jgi:hypothetical protein
MPYSLSPEFQAIAFAEVFYFTLAERSHTTSHDYHLTVFRQARSADRSMVPGQRQNTQELRQSYILVATIYVTAVTTRSLIYSVYELMLEAGIYRL